VTPSTQHFMQHMYIYYDIVLKVHQKTKKCKKEKKNVANY